MHHQRTRPLSDTEPFPHSQLADLLHVAPKTITGLAKDGRLPYRRTLGGHRCYSEQAIGQLVASLAQGMRVP